MSKQISSKSPFSLRIKLIDLCVALYIIAIVLFDGSVLFYLSTTLLCLVGLLNILAKKQLLGSGFAAMMFCFIVFNIITISLGVPQYSDVSIDRLFTVSLNFLVNYVLFVYLTDFDNRIRVMQIFKISAYFLIVYIIVVNFSSVFSGRFGTGTPYLFGLTGISGRTYNSNTVAKIVYLTIIFSVFLYNNTGAKKEGKINYFGIGLLLLFLFLTGSRTGIILILCFLMLYYTTLSRNVSSKIKYIFGGFMLIMISYVLIMNVSFLYNIVGNRVEVLLNGVSSGWDYESGTSAYYRDIMIQRGISLFKERPLFGWGLDNFTKLSPYGTFSHSNFIELLVSCGIVGFLIYYFAYTVLLKNTFKFRNNEFVKNESCMFLSYLVPMIILNVSTVNYVDRLTLFMLYMCAAASYDWKKHC